VLTVAASAVGGPVDRIMVVGAAWLPVGAPFPTGRPVPSGPSWPRGRVLTFRCVLACAGGWVGFTTDPRGYVSGRPRLSGTPVFDETARPGATRPAVVTRHTPPRPHFDDQVDTTRLRSPADTHHVDMIMRNRGADGRDRCEIALSAPARTIHAISERSWCVASRRTGRHGAVASKAPSIAPASCDGPR